MLDVPGTAALSPFSHRLPAKLHEDVPIPSPPSALFCAPSSFLTSLALTRADEAADKDQLRNLEKTCAAALVKGDHQRRWASIFANDWVIVDGSGQTHPREEIFKSLSSGDLKFISYELGEMEVRIVGDTAVVIGHGHPRGQMNGEAFEENEVFTDTFARVHGGKWRCILSHSTEVPDLEQK